MHQFVANSTYFLLLIIIISIGMIGFNSFQNTANPQMTAAASQQTAIQGTVIQVGTDLDMRELQPISKAYYQQSGVRIEWLPIVSTEPNITAANDAITHPTLNLADNLATNLATNPATNPIMQQQNQAHQQSDPSVTLLTLHPNKPKPLKLGQGLDMLLMHSAYSLDIASQNHQLQALGSEDLMSKIPKVYQDPAGQWFGVSQYGRTMVYHKNRVNPAELVNYSVVAADKWLGKLCMTSLMHSDNQAIAKLLQTYRGEKETAEILAGWQRNMGKPLPDDAHVLAQIEQGNCDVGIVNSDAFWQYAKTNPATLVRLTWANQINQGVVTNTLTAAAVAEGNDIGAALGFMEWLLSDKGQALLAFYTSTFPVVALTEADINQQAIRPLWANYKVDSTPLATIMANKSMLKPALVGVAPNLPVSPPADMATNGQAATQ